MTTFIQIHKLSSQPKYVMEKILLEYNRYDDNINGVDGPLYEAIEMLRSNFLDNKEVVYHFNLLPWKWLKFRSCIILIVELKTHHMLRAPLHFSMFFTFHFYSWIFKSLVHANLHCNNVMMMASEEDEDDDASRRGGDRRSRSFRGVLKTKLSVFFFSFCPCVQYSLKLCLCFCCNPLTYSPPNFIIRLFLSIFRLTAETT